MAVGPFDAAKKSTRWPPASFMLATAAGLASLDTLSATIGLDAFSTRSFVVVDPVSAEHETDNAQNTAPTRLRTRLGTRMITSPRNRHEYFNDDMARQL
jgi:hypothetical protein